MIFRSYVCFVRLKISLQADEIVPTSFVRKNLYVSITSFSQLQLSVSFLFFIRFSMNIGGKTKFFHLGRPKWTRTTFKNLSLQKRYRFFRVKHKASFSFKGILFPCSLVGPSGLEPPTSCLSGTRSNLLSYEPLWLVSDFLFTWFS